MIKDLGDFFGEPRRWGSAVRLKDCDALTTKVLKPSGNSLSTIQEYSWPFSDFRDGS